MEWTLQQQGFDYCYDKRLYDRLVHEPPRSVRGHLQADPDYQERLLRFIENHDEPRAAADVRRRSRRGRPRSSCRRSRARGSTTTASSRDCGTHIPVFLAPRARRAARRRAARVLRAAAAARSPSPACATATGGCASAAAGPTTRSAAPCSPGAGAANDAPPRRRQPCRGSRAGAVHLPWDDLAGRRWKLGHRLGRRRLRARRRRDAGDQASTSACDRGSTLLRAHRIKPRQESAFLRERPPRAVGRSSFLGGVRPRPSRDHRDVP